MFRFVSVSAPTAHDASSHKILLLSGDPLYVGMDLTIASFDAISEVNMVSFCLRGWRNRVYRIHNIPITCTFLGHIVATVVVMCCVVIISTLHCGKDN